MTDDIIKAVCRAIYEEFGSCTIYTEPVAQALHEPCFFVLCANSFIDRRLCSRYACTFTVAVQYFPENTINCKSEFGSIADRLFFALEQIELSGVIVNGTEMHYEIADDILHFFVTFCTAAEKARVTQKMESIAITDNIKQR